MTKFWVLIGISAFAWSLAGNATAKDVKEAKRHFKAGTALLKVEDFEGAVTEFEISYRLNKHKSALFNLANCYKAIHQYGKSLTAFEQLLSEHGKQLSREMKAGATKTIAELESLVATVRVNVDQPGAVIKFNEEYEVVSPQEKPFVVGPGNHKLEVQLEGFESHKMDVEVFSKEDKTLVISLRPKGTIDLIPVLGDQPMAGSDANADLVLNTPPLHDERRLSPLTWTGIVGTAISGIGTGIFWGLWSKSNRSFDEADDIVSESNSRDEEYTQALIDSKDAASQAGTYGNLAVAFSIVTGVLIASTSISLALDLALPAEKQASDSHSLVLGPGNITVTF